YLYVRKLTQPVRPMQLNDLLLFLPLVLLPIAPLWLLPLLIMPYLFLSHRLIQHFYKQLQPVLMDRSRAAFRWLDKALWLLGILFWLSLLNDLFYIVFVAMLMTM